MLQISTDFLKNLFSTLLWSLNSSNSFGGFTQSEVILKSCINYKETWGLLFENILSISSIILSLAILCSKACLTFGSRAAMKISSDIFKSNLYANLIVLKTLNGSSTNVFKGCNGVFAILFLRSIKPLPVKSSIKPLFIL